MRLKRFSKLEMKALPIILGLMLILVAPTNGAKPLTDTVYLVEGTSIDITTNEYGHHVLQTYCYPGKPLSMVSLFESVEFLLNIGNDVYTAYGGSTPEEVLEHYKEQRSMFSFTLVQMSPFEQQCIGIVSNQPYNVRLKFVKFDLWRFLQLGLGIALFWNAGQLAKIQIFYYLAGIVLGICSSLLTIVHILSTLFPRRSMIYGLLIGGELVSFLVYYCIGPPKNSRSRRIIQKVLQANGCAMMYFSSWHTSLCGILLAMIFVSFYCPKTVLTYVQKFYRRRSPSKRRLLTLKEYHQQGAKETKRSLDELRKYVNSPNCRHWKTVANLRDPVQFASFANGASDLKGLEFDHFVDVDDDNDNYNDHSDDNDYDFDEYHEDEESDDDDIDDNHIDEAVGA